MSWKKAFQLKKHLADPHKLEYEEIDAIIATLESSPGNDDSVNATKMVAKRKAKESDKMEILEERKKKPREANSL